MCLQHLAMHQLPALASFRVPHHFWLHSFHSSHTFVNSSTLLNFGELSVSCPCWLTQKHIIFIDCIAENFFILPPPLGIEFQVENNFFLVFVEMFCLLAFSITVNDTSVILIPDPLCVTCVCSQNTWESPLYLLCSKISWWCALIYVLCHSQCCTLSGSFQSGKFWEISFYDFDNFLPPLLFSSLFLELLWVEWKTNFMDKYVILGFLSCFQLFFLWCFKRLYHRIHLVFN